MRKIIINIIAIATTIALILLFFKSLGPEYWSKDTLIVLGVSAIIVIPFCFIYSKCVESYARKRVEAMEAQAKILFNIK